MAYNTDVGAKELFTNLSMLFLGNAKTGTAWITISYSVGLALGMILFFNHLGNKKFDSDPTPLEIQMRLYENDISTSIIKDTSRRGESVDVKQS
jgi:stage V sporulation protein AA